MGWFVMAYFAILAIACVLQSAVASRQRSGAPAPNAQAVFDTECERDERVHPFNGRH